MANATSEQRGGSAGPGRTSAALVPDGGLRGWRSVFAALGVVWALLLTAAMLLGNFAAGHGAPPATWARMGSSLALVAAAWLTVYCYRRTTAMPFATAIAIGMSLGTIGDFYNAGLLDPLAPLGEGVLGGIAAFGLGHIAYITGCTIAARRGRLPNPTALAVSLAVWLTIGLVGWYLIVYQSEQERTRSLVGPALPYSLLLAGTAGFATGLAAQGLRARGRPADRRPASLFELARGGFVVLALGAALFFASDMILACGMFRGGIPHSTVLVWLTYGPGQMLIVYAAPAICRGLALCGTRPGAAA